MFCKAGPSSCARPSVILSLPVVLPVLLLALVGASCRIEKTPGYFQQGVDTTLVDMLAPPKLRIEAGDELSIVFYSDNPEATAIYNQASGGAASSPVSVMREGNRQAGSGAMATASGYVVDTEGNVRIHGLGPVRVAGLSLAELERRLVDRINAMGVLANPYCIVRFSGIRITVLGEVKNPGSFRAQQDRLTVMEALAMAGDILPSGRKEDVLLVRQDENRRTYTLLDLTRQDIFRSPHFTLKQNDMIVVQANKLQQNMAFTMRQQYLGLAVSVASILVLLFNLIINL